MPLPALVKTWLISSNNTVAATGNYVTEAQNLLFAIKNRIVAFASWSMRYSCSSTVAGAAGDGVDRIPAASNLVWASGDVTGNRSWMVFESIAGHQLLIECRGSNQRYLRVVFSPAAGFTGGTTASRPTAADEIIVIDGSSTSLSTWVGNGTGGGISRAWVFHVWASADGAVLMVSLCTNNTAPVFMYFGAVADAVAPWTNPCIAAVWSGNDTSTLLSDAAGYPLLMYGFYADQTYAAGNPGAAGNFPTGRAKILCTSEAMGVGSTGGTTDTTTLPKAGGERVVVVNEITNEWELPQVGVGCLEAGSRGMKHGRLFDVFWCSTGLSTGDTAPGDGTRTRVVVADLLLPWNGSVPVNA